MNALSALIFAFAILGSASAKPLLCYYASWSVYIAGDHSVPPQALDPSLCTHILYAFVAITPEGGLQVEDDYVDIQLGGYTNLVNLKNSNPSLKVLLSIGGGLASAQTFSQIAADAGKRAAMVGSARYFMETYGFDGIDIDWEVPGANDKGNFISLLQDFRNDFNRNGWLVTAAVSANAADGYDIPQMSNLLDFINIMTYDFYGPWSAYTGQNSALYASSIESEWEKQNLNIASCLNNWRNAGANPNKMIVGLAFYGHSFALQDPNNRGLHAPISGPGRGGNIIGGEGAWTYNEYCETRGSWNCQWDEEQRVPICIQGDLWLGIDTEDSLREKVAYINNNGFGGAMVWSIDQDDIHGTCGAAKPLLRTVRDNLN